MSSKNINALEISHLSKYFAQGKNTIQILKEANLKVKKGEVVSLVGPSGSGKTTLLQLCGLLDNANSGSIKINEIEYYKASDKVKTEARLKNIGFVYQFHHLLPEFSALENVIMPLIIAGQDIKEAKKLGMEHLEELGIAARAKHRPAELSGGEQQRVAIARALIHKPSLILADEPTGNLDAHNAKNTFDILLKAAKNHKVACLIVTHNLDLAAKCERIVTINNAKIVKYQEN